tara:strand:- start:24 stop:710 length:687 start_codon:yes stop_codon:yes gene_type:complete
MRNYYNKFLDKTVTIIRGVPGSGKRYLIADLEKDSISSFSICDRNQYFLHNGVYNFKGSEISKSECASRMKFLQSLTRKIKNIYVIGYFNEKQMYEEYIQLARMNNYKVKVIEIKCKDRNTLNYFNNRSVYNPPNLKSRNCYSNWEDDSEAAIYEPYIESLPGDCLPNVANIDLDKQLNNYWDNDFEPFVPEEEIEYYDEFIDHVNEQQFINILRREWTNIKKKKVYI